jgi:dipeptidyl aminopeptidase/acylaminoacyl peptidase
MRRSLALSLAALFVFCTYGRAQPGATIAPPAALTVDGVPPIPASIVEAMAKYADYRTANLVAWHPSKREMLVATRFANVFQLHHVRMPGGARTQVTFFESGIAPTGSDARAWFEPSGHIVYVRDVAGGKRLEQISHFDPTSGTTTTAVEGRGRVLTGAWSRAGDRLAYTSSRRNGQDFDLYVVAPEDPKSDRLVAELKGVWTALDWSPDGRAILLRELLSSINQRLWLIDAAGGGPRALSPDSAEAIQYGATAWFARDGRTVYVTTDRGTEFRHVARLDVSARTLTPMTPWLRAEVDEIALSPDGKLLAFVANEDGVGTLHLLDAASGRERSRPKVPAGHVSALAWHPSGELGFNLTSARQPGDVYSYEPRRGTVVRWTFSELGGITEAALRDYEIVRWTSFDGRMISGILHRPAPRFTGRRPVMINIHGGPSEQARQHFWGRSTYFLNELGVAIIQPNVRGSTGFGKTFQTLDDGRRREDAVKDIGALLDWIAAQPDLDPQRVWVIGGSYGGYMALATAAKYGDRIRCAFVGQGISNFVTHLERTAPEGRDQRRAEYGDERDPNTRKFLERISPLTHKDAIRTPLFVVHGKNDTQVPPEESQQIVEAVKKNGTPVWYIVASDEGHVFGRRANLEYVLWGWAAFAQEYLLK